VRDVVVVAATRTAIGSFQGTLAQIPAVELGAAVVRSLLATTKIDPALVGQVIMGQVLTAAAGQNPARQAAIKAGLPFETPALTINRVCGSGLEAVHLAAQAIACGETDVAIGGGMESMSLAPHALPGSRTGLKLGPGTLVDTLVIDGLWDAFNQYHMGNTAENLARRHGITREQQDEYAVLSQSRARAAIAAGAFQSQITPVLVPQKKGDPLAFSVDEQPRSGTDMAALARLRPAFDRDGTVTAGNSSTLNDGAAAVMLMSAQVAQRMGVPVLARIAAYASAGVDPAFMGEGPVPATTRMLAKAGWKLGDVDLLEANEAFAAQALSVAKLLALDMSKVNVNGGAIALGHPIGASGCRVLVTLIHEMTRRNVRRGIAMLCVGGGQGVALAVEREQATRI
jgi:acetyl-CoA C-acetyltransferase